MYRLKKGTVEIQKTDIISIDKTMTKESKHTKTKAFVFVVPLKRAVLNGSTKSCFKISYEGCQKGVRV